MRIVKYIALFVSVLSFVACTSTVGNNVVNDKGELENKTMDWPALDDASLPEGIFPNMQELGNIGKGMTKKEIYNLIERPHFQEMNGAREWNYIMKFRQIDNTVKICQYKILFDDDMLAQNFYWLPNDCLYKEKPKVERFNLSADALFVFDKGSEEDIKEAGKMKLDNLAQTLIEEGNKAKVHLVGYTDYKGSEIYNMKLSQQRARSVKAYLIDKGLNADNITIEGKGEANPIKQCAKDLSRQEEIKCLQPNRRVSVTITRD